MMVRGNALPVCGTPQGLDRVLGDIFNEFPFAGSAPSGRVPAIDTWEDEKSFTVEAELPGVKNEEIEISVIGNELRISGGTERPAEEATAKYHRRERTHGKFSRILRFPLDLNAETVEARHENGVLTIVLPKAAAAMPRKIEVR
jgi:HSP20 family protein